jgi:BirA family transcriptional regulator, biotin operon repressor / biotin---[acetyl-CoA-carboxylase] ligase
MLQCGQEINMVLTAERIQSKLAPRPLRFYEQADSTNDLALDWLRAGAMAGSAVVTDEQVKGRGRLGRTWYTPPGTALILSVVLSPKVEDLGQITMLGAVAIAEMIEHLGTADVGIKWPNDVLLQGKKVSGVLSEAVWNGDKLQGAVLGMGINVRIDFSGTELAGTAISIEPALGHAVDRLDLLDDLLSRVDYWYERLQTSALFDAWKSRLNMLGKMVTVQQGTLHGLAESVDQSGALLLRDESGQLHRVVAGDIGLGS